MAVYTEVSDTDLQAFVAQYDIGDVVSCKGIAEGVENSNYLLQTEGSSFILTLYEKRVAPEDLPFFLGLMDHLADRGFPCPTPVHGLDGEALRTLCGRPAALTSFLQGMWPRRITPDHCHAVGDVAARLHLAAEGFGLSRRNALNRSGWRSLFEATKSRADEIMAGLDVTLQTELAWLEDAWPSRLPNGIIHADLFPDNVFFLNDSLSGVIDFYFACSGSFAYELSICLNAWCFEPDNSFNVAKARRLIEGYSAVRPLCAAEIAALPVLARGSAMRFLMTRMYDLLNHPAGALVQPKDPLEYLEKLRFHQEVAGPEAYGLEA